MGFLDDGGASVVTEDAITSPVAGWTNGNKEEGRVEAILRIGSRVYLGGYMTSVRKKDGTLTTRSYLVAHDQATGELIESFSPVVNDRVEVISPGWIAGTLLIGGRFTTVNGQARTYLAMIDAATGATLADIATFDNHVRAIALDGASLYVGGRFDAVNATTRHRVAKMDVTTLPATLDPGWLPGCARTGAGTDDVRALTLHTPTNKIIVAGWFTKARPSSTTTYTDDATKSGIVAFTLDTGEFATWTDTAAGAGWTGADEVVQLSGVNSYGEVYGAVGGLGGRAVCWDAATGVRKWTRGSDGNLQAVALVGDKAIFGMHGDNVNTVLDTFNTDTIDPAFKVARHKMFVLDRDGSINDWAPAFTSTQGVLGVWAMHDDGMGKLHVGGDFTLVDGVARPRYVVFAHGFTTEPPPITGSEDGYVYPTSFDALRHHVGLGPDVDNLRGLVCVGPLAKQLANPIFEKPSNIGTDDLIGQTTHSVWSQDDYSGGEFQYDWKDPAMFAECVSMIPNQLGRSVRTVRPIIAARTGDASNGTVPISMEVIDQYLFIIFNNSTPQGRVYRYNPANPNNGLQAETVSTSYLPTGKLITSVYWNQTTNRFWMGTNAPRIHTFDWNGAAAAGSRLVHHDDVGTPVLAANPIKAITGLHLFGQMRFVVTTHTGTTVDDNRLWLWVSGSGANAKYKQVGVLPGDYVTSVTYNNAVYFLTRKANNRTQLSMSQGDQVFPVLDLPYYFVGQSMIEYAGRLYIGGIGLDFEGGPTHGELYEVTGTSLRLVRTFAAEAGRPTPPNVPGRMGGTGGGGTVPAWRKRLFTKMGALCVAEGLLWMPDSSYTGFEAYDATSDAFFGGPRYREGDDPDISFQKMVPFGNSIYAWSAGPFAGPGSKTGLFRTERTPDVGNPYIAYLITSDFHPEPARTKVWSKFSCLTRYDSDLELSYSIDGGNTWTVVTSPTIRQEGYNWLREWDLISVPESTRIRFRVAFLMSGNANESAAELVAHSLSFLVRGDTKRRWQMTVNASVAPEGLDGAMVEQDPSDLKDYLWTLKDTAGPLVYRDTDRRDYRVIVTDLAQTQPVIDDDSEAFINLTIIEV